MLLCVARLSLPIAILLFGWNWESLRAQTFTGSVRGLITDASGALISGAAVVVTSIGTGETRTAKSSANGEYLVPSLPPGDYHVAVEFSGFKRFERTPLRIDVTEDVRVDVALAPFTFGDVSRSLPSTRAPGLQDFDISLFKSNRIRERWNTQLRFETFNVLNRANFSAPGTVFGNAQFGIISGTGSARVLQIAAKFIF